MATRAKATPPGQDTARVNLTAQEVIDREAEEALGPVTTLTEKVNNLYNQLDTADKIKYEEEIIYGLNHLQFENYDMVALKLAGAQAKLDVLDANEVAIITQIVALVQAALGE